MAYRLSALVYAEEVNPMILRSCDVPGCRKGGCTMPKPTVN